MRVVPLPPLVLWQRRCRLCVLWASSSFVSYAPSSPIRSSSSLITTAFCLGNRTPKAFHMPRTSSASDSRKRPPLAAAHVASSTKRRATNSTGTVDDLQKQITDNLHQRSTKATKDWFTNYVKGTTWIGCKLPVVRQCVQEVIPPIKTKKTAKAKESTGTSTESVALWGTDVLLDTAVRLLEQRECDVKLAGMLILSECFPPKALCSAAVLDRLEQSVLEPNLVNDWSSADWFAMKVLRKIVLEANSSDEEEMLIQRVLNYTQNGTNLWYRRCGVIPFVQYYNHRDVLPDDIGRRIVQACETSLLTSPSERFTQTGVSWVLRYMLSPKTATKSEREAAAAMVLKHGALWTNEAKKSLTEKLSKTDPLATKIRRLGK